MKKTLAKKPSNPFKIALCKFLKNTPAVVALVIFLLIIMSCVLAPIITDGDYMSFTVSERKGGFTREHPLGTDALGRDMLTRLLYGGRSTFKIAFMALFYGAVAGSAIGIISGYFGGKSDTLIMRLIEALSSVPVILLVVAVECAWGWGEGNYMYAIALSFIPVFAKVIRASVMDIVGNEYIEAAKALGNGDLSIIFHHVIRNIAAPFIVQLSGSAAESLLTCPVMGYLGFGLNPPLPELGSIVASNYKLIRSSPAVALVPCIIIVVCAMSLNLIGNGLRDAFATENRSA